MYNVIIWSILEIKPFKLTKLMRFADPNLGSVNQHQMVYTQPMVVTAVMLPMDVAITDKLNFHSAFAPNSSASSLWTV